MAGSRESPGQRIVEERGIGREIKVLTDVFVNLTQSSYEKNIMKISGLLSVSL